MAEPPRGTSARFDRIRRVDPGRSRDDRGKEALYSTSPTSSASAQVQLTCQRCEVSSGLTVIAALRVLRPPVLVDPFRRRVWTRCPVCARRSWLEIRAGQALRVLLQRAPTQ